MFASIVSGRGGRHFDMAGAIGKGIAEAPEAALCFAGFDLKIEIAVFSFGSQLTRRLSR